MVPGSERRRISTGSPMEQAIGYCRAIVVPDAGGDWVFVSGTTGFDYQTTSISDGVVEQARQCLNNIDAALQQARCGAGEVVRVHYILPRREDFALCWPVLRSYFGEAPPATTMIEAGLADPRMKIEIEVTARKAA